MKKIFNNYLTEIETAIENARQKKRYKNALYNVCKAKGCIQLAFFLDLIDNKEYEILFDKFADYFDYYYYLILNS